MEREYTDEQAHSGVAAELPTIETWPNQYGASYEIEIIMPEVASVCPRTGLPDLGTITLRYVPQDRCLELKSLKLYTVAYRNIGIFSENLVNRFLRDIVVAAAPQRATVEGKFNARGGILTNVTAVFECATDRRGCASGLFQSPASR
jgi:7-cyano-7-deazaguanine reductase